MIRHPTLLLATLCLAAITGYAAASPSPTPGPANPAKKAIAVESLPYVEKWTNPEFPAGLPDKVNRGSAILRVIISDIGAVTSARVLRASKVEFGEAALGVIKKWTYSPGLDSGKPVAMCIDVPFEFEREGRTEPRVRSPPFAAGGDDPGETGGRSAGGLSKNAHRPWPAGTGHLSLHG